MLIDIIVFILLVMALFKGLRNGLIIALFSFLAFVIGLAAALKLSALLAGFLGNNISVSKKWLPFIAFFVVFFIVTLLVRLGARMLEGVARLAMLGWLNKLGGVVFYVLIYLFIISIVLFYAQQLHLVKPETFSASVTWPWIQPVAPKMVNAIGSIVPVFRDLFTKLLDFFQNVSDKNHSAQYSFLYP
jgi:membrane protein required for colicin V production